MAQQSSALNYLLLAVPCVGLYPAGDIEFHFAYFAPFCSSQLNEGRPNVIKHDIRPELIGA